MTSSRRRLAPWLRRPFRAIGWLLRPEHHFPVTAAIALFVVAIAFDTFDSFGLDDVLERAVGNSIDAVLGPLYGRGLGEERRGQDAIAVVLIDKATIDEDGQDGLPLSYAVQSRILNRVAAEHPRAILFDVHYPRPRVALRQQSRWGVRAQDPQAGREQQDFDQLVETYKNISQTIPVYIGPVARVGAKPQPIEENRPLAPLADLAQTELARTAAPNSNVKGLHEVDLAVDPLEVRKYGASQSGPEARAPAAIGLYRAYCDTRKREGDAGACPNGVPDLAKETMIVRWGFGASPWQERFLPEDVRYRCRVGFWNYLGHEALRKWWEKKSQIDSRRLGEHCSYSDIIAFSNMNVRDTGGPLGKDIDDDPSRPSDATDDHASKLSTILRNRIVLIGFDAPESGDRRIVPFYGDVPGVLTHAMALDNLIQWHGRPFLAPHPVLLGLDELAVLRYASTLAIVALSFLLHGWLNGLFLSRETIEQRHDLTTGIAFVALVLVWCGIFGWGLTKSWPISSEIFGGVLPGGLLAMMLLHVRGKSGNKGKRHGNGTVEDVGRVAVDRGGDDDRGSYDGDADDTRTGEGRRPV